MEKSKTIEKLFSHIVTYSYLILPFLFLLTRPKKRDLVVLAIYGFVFWSLLYFYNDIPKELRRVAYQPIYTSLEYTFFTLLFYNNTKARKYKILIIVLSLVFFVFQALYVTAFEKGRVDSVSIGVESILIFIYISIFFLESLNITRGEHIYSNHVFWIAVGLLFYLGGSFFINILASSFSDEEFEKYFYFNYIADTIKTILFAVAFMLCLKKTNSSLKSNSKNIPYLDMI